MIVHRILARNNQESIKYRIVDVLRRKDFAVKGKNYENLFAVSFVHPWWKQFDLVILRSLFNETVY
jgi:hypothetical protein